MSTPPSVSITGHDHDHASGADNAVVEVNHARAEAAFVQQVELHADIAGEGRFATPDHDRHQEQVEFVDQPGPDRLGGEVGSAHRDVTSRSGLHLPNGPGVEI